MFDFVEFSSTLGVLSTIITSGGVVVGFLYGFFIKPQVEKQEQKREDEKNEIVKKIESENKRLLEKIEEQANKIDRNSIRLTRNEYLLAISTQPDNVDAIENLFDEYRRMGGNSYITALHRDWEQQFAKPSLERRLKQYERGEKK